MLQVTPSRKTMTLNLTEAEMKALEELSATKDISKTAVLRQALRLYQMVEARIARGEKLFFEHDASKQNSWCYERTNSGLSERARDRTTRRGDPDRWRYPRRR